MTTLRRIGLAIAAIALLPGLPAGAQPSPPQPDPLTWATAQASLKLGVEAGTQVLGNVNAWWNLSEVFAPDSAFDPDRSWLELYGKPSLTGRLSVSHSLVLYGAVSAVGSSNIGRDVFDQGNQGRVLLEEAGGGIRATAGSGWTIDLSGGAQPYVIASGMLVSVGASNGFERGATTLFPRRAWQNSFVARVTKSRVTAQGFYLDPNELASSDTHTKIAGTRLDVSLGQDAYVGGAYLDVFTSEYPYVAAPLTFVANGRDGLRAAHVYAKLRPKASPTGWVTAIDYVREWNPRIDLRAWAFSGEVARTLAGRRWTPTLGYTFRYYSGDDGGTAALERFDPLFYDGGPTAFASGSNGSLAFYNSNIIMHRLRAGFVLTRRDILDAFYFHLRASEVNSPIQFGQALRIDLTGGVPSLAVGVPTPHLSDDVYVQYTRVVNPHTFVTVGAAYSIPGAGLEAIGADRIRNWFGALGNVVLSF